MAIVLLVFFPLLSAPGFYALGRVDRRSRDHAVILMTGLELALSLSLCLSAAGNAGFYGVPSGAGEAAIDAGPSLILAPLLHSGLTFTTDGFRTVYSLVTSLLWFVTTVFAREYFRWEREGLDAYWMFLLMTLGATQGVMLSADFMTTFVFFEILSFTSFTWVIHEETEDAVKAGYTYLFIAVIGGLVLFMGMALLNFNAGTLDYEGLRAVVAGLPDAPADGTGYGLAASRVLLYPAGLCILLGFGAKAGMFPLHVWLPLAHPVAPSPASALLSGLLTKVGVFGVLMTALEVLYDSAAFGLTVLVLGLITMALGAALALFSVNLKRTLACSSMSQIGFILTGVGSMVLARAVHAAASLPAPVGVGEGYREAAETAREAASEAAELALSGALAHMVNHSLLKLVLFMAAGVVLMNLHALNLNDIRGWGRNKPALKLAFALGGLGISGVPLLNGYLSKTMLHEGIVAVTKAAEALREADFARLLSSTVVLDSAGLLSDPSAVGRLAAFLHVSEWVFLISGGFTFAYMLKLYFCVFVEENADPKRQARFDRSPRCMDRVTTAAVAGAAFLLVPMGQPWLVTRLTAHMTGLTFEFAAFSLTNLRGALISLFIGAEVYLLIVKSALCPAGVYADRWPEKLDLEGRVYRPLFTEWLPAVGGAVAAVLAENKVLKPVCRGILFLGAVVARALSDSLDASAAFLRHTVLREVKVYDGTDPVRAGRGRVVWRATHEALAPLLENFSFALLMTCVGIFLILAFLVVSLL